MARKKSQNYASLWANWGQIKQKIAEACVGQGRVAAQVLSERVRHYIEIVRMTAQYQKRECRL